MSALAANGVALVATKEAAAAAAGPAKKRPRPDGNLKAVKTARAKGDGGQKKNAQKAKAPGTPGKKQASLDSFFTYGAKSVGEGSTVAPLRQRQRSNADVGSNVDWLLGMPEEEAEELMDVVRAEDSMSVEDAEPQEMDLEGDAALLHSQVFGAESDAEDAVMVIEGRSSPSAAASGPPSLSDMFSSTPRPTEFVCVGFAFTDYDGNDLQLELLKPQTVYGNAEAYVRSMGRSSERLHVSFTAHEWWIDYSKKGAKLVVSGHLLAPVQVPDDASGTRKLSKGARCFFLLDTPFSHYRLLYSSMQRRLAICGAVNEALRRERGKTTKDSVLALLNSHGKYSEQHLVQEAPFIINQFGWESRMKVSKFYRWLVRCNNPFVLSVLGKPRKGLNLSKAEREQRKEESKKMKEQAKEERTKRKEEQKAEREEKRKKKREADKLRKQAEKEELRKKMDAAKELLKQPIEDTLLPSRPLPLTELFCTMVPDERFGADLYGMLFSVSQYFHSFKDVIGLRSRPTCQQIMDLILMTVPSEKEWRMISQLHIKLLMFLIEGAVENQQAWAAECLDREAVNKAILDVQFLAESSFAEHQPRPSDDFSKPEAEDVGEADVEAEDQTSQEDGASVGTFLQWLRSLPLTEKTWPAITSYYIVHRMQEGDASASEPLLPLEELATKLMTSDYNFLPPREKLRILNFLITDTLDYRAIRDEVNVQHEVQVELKKKIAAVRSEVPKPDTEKIAQLEEKANEAEKKYSEAAKELDALSNPWYESRRGEEAVSRQEMLSRKADQQKLVDRLNRARATADAKLQKELDSVGKAERRLETKLAKLMHEKMESQCMGSSLMLGRDRDRNTYWWFSCGDLDSVILIRSATADEWRVLTCEQAFDALLMRLDPRGKREAKLVNSLKKNAPVFRKYLPYCPVDALPPAWKVEEDEGPVWKLSVQAPDALSDTIERKETEEMDEEQEAQRKRRAAATLNSLRLFGIRLDGSLAEGDYLTHSTGRPRRETHLYNQVLLRSVVAEVWQTADEIPWYFLKEGWAVPSGERGGEFDLHAAIDHVLDKLRAVDPRCLTQWFQPRVNKLIELADASRHIASASLLCFALTHNVFMKKTLLDDSCVLCWRSNSPSKIVLCDECDAGCHLFCLSPPLKHVPSGQWLCPGCTNVM